MSDLFTRVMFYEHVATSLSALKSSHDIKFSDDGSEIIIILTNLYKRSFNKQRSKIQISDWKNHAALVENNGVKYLKAKLSKLDPECFQSQLLPQQGVWRGKNSEKLADKPWNYENTFRHSSHFAVAVRKLVPQSSSWTVTENGITFETHIRWKRNLKKMKEAGEANTGPELQP